MTAVAHVIRTVTSEMNRLIQLYMNKKNNIHLKHFQSITHQNIPEQASHLTGRKSILKKCIYDYKKLH